MPLVKKPRKVKLCKDGEFIQFDSCEDAAHFLWCEVRNQSIKFSSVLNELHYKASKGKPIYGYVIEKDKNYDPNFERYH